MSEPALMPEPTVVLAVTDAAAIARFARETLGCGCPDAVFDDIGATWLDPYRFEVRIGGRLLLHLIRVGDDDGVTGGPALGSAQSPVPAMARWLADGLAARERDGFNRFRLVLCSADPQRLCLTCRPTFDALTGDDVRAHLHCLADGAILDLSAAFAVAPF